MLLSNKDSQINFLKEKIAKKLGISRKEIDQRKKEIVQYAYQKF